VIVSVRGIKHPVLNTAREKLLLLKKMLNTQWMPAQRKEGKRLWGGYLEPDDFDRLDADAKRRGFATRTDFLAWFAKNCQSLVTRGTKSENSEEK
jgi:hypothetical protein